MERQLWGIISTHLTTISRVVSKGRFIHSTAKIVRIYLWSVIHDRPVYWALDKRNWSGVKPPPQMPNQSTMSRRMRHPKTLAMINQLMDQLQPIDRHALVLRMDGKPLPVAKHSQDKQATIGRGAGGFQKGFKIHAIYSENSRPVAYRVAPMNVDERVVAKEMLEQTPLGEGYLLADANYETNNLYDQASSLGRILVTPRRFKNAKGLGQSRKHSVHRIEMIQRMKAPSSFIRNLLKTRSQVETHFANLSNFAAGLTHLPPWVRGCRVSTYVTAKILIRIAKDKLNSTKTSA